MTEQNAIMPFQHIGKLQRGKDEKHGKASDICIPNYSIFISK